MQDIFDTIRIILEIIAILFLPTIVFLFKKSNDNSNKLIILEEKVNAEFSKRLEYMERKIDSFDTRIENKLDRLEQNLNAKIEMMTAIMSNFVKSAYEEDGNKN